MAGRDEVLTGRSAGSPRPFGPPCPITGERQNRLVQWVSTALLADLWSWEFRVDARPAFAGATRLGLWESPTGLYFFDPPIPGDARFYETLYRRIGTRALSGRTAYRGDCNLAARHVGRGARVLDIGCGFGAFRHLIPEAEYVGLDPNFPAEAGETWKRGETLEVHLADRAGQYDVACAFQVLEHVPDPVSFLRNMAQAVKPGGNIMVGVPHVPSAHTRIPNFLINAPPHHLTWWTPKALEIAARSAGLVKPAVEVAPWSRVNSLIYWISRCSWVKCRDRFFRHDWSWHAAAAVGFVAGYALWKIRPEPRPTDDAGAALLLVAERPT